MKNQVIRIRNGWGNAGGNPPKESWNMILEHLSNGEAISVWNGLLHEAPKTWKEGPCSLQVKAGKKRKLVTGKLMMESIGCWDDGYTYHYVFIPNRPRELRKTSVSQLINVLPSETMT